jgi:hypothetical protein
MDLLRDFYSDRSTTRLLEVESEFSDAWITGHAQRVGLAGARTPADAMERLLPTIRADFYFESDRIRDAGFENADILRESANPEENAVALARFLSIPEERALEIARTDDLFAD